MANTIPVKIMVPVRDVEKIDRLVEEGRFASRADFVYKSAFLVMSVIDGTTKSLYGFECPELQGESFSTKRGEKLQP